MRPDLIKRATIIAVSPAHRRVDYEVPTSVGDTYAIRTYWRVYPREPGTKWEPPVRAMSEPDTELPWQVYSAGLQTWRRLPDRTTDHLAAHLPDPSDVMARAAWEEWWARMEE